MEEEGVDVHLPFLLEGGEVNAEKDAAALREGMEEVEELDDTLRRVSLSDRVRRTLMWIVP